MVSNLNIYGKSMRGQTSEKISSDSEKVIIVLSKNIIIQVWTFMKVQF